MTDEHRCVTCHVFRKEVREAKAPPRLFDRAHVCEPCRTHFANILYDVPECCALLPDALERGTAEMVRVTGGDTEAALPFREDVWDLMGPLRIVQIRAWVKDQVGHLSVATTLDSWARDFVDLRGRGEVGPNPTVVELVGWLSNRLEWACDEHPAVDEFATEINSLIWTLRKFVGHETARPQPCVGIPCRRCDLMTLARLADGSGDIECQNPACRTIYRPTDYLTWTRLLAASARG